MKYFNRSEFKKDPDRLDPRLMEIMDGMRHLAGVPIHIHVAWSDNGHAKHSYHYKGMAVDFHFAGLKPVEQFAVIRCFPDLHGIGFYPWWNHPGWHVDFRSKELLWISPESGRYLYSTEELIGGILKF